MRYLSVAKGLVIIMTRMSHWKKKLSIILALCISFNLNGSIVALAQASDEMVNSQIIHYVNQAKPLQNDEKIILTSESSDFEIDENNVLVHYTGSDTIVTVPDGVTSIASSAFWKTLDGNGITQIHLPNTLTSLQDYAFSGCHTLTEISLPDNVASIGQGVFYFSKGLLNIHAGENNLSFSSEDGVLFNKDKTQIICFPQARTQTSFEIPDTVKTVIDFAFDNATSLTNLVIPQSVTIIGKFAFRDGSFSQISLPNNLISIDELAFARCINLKSVTHKH